jgi:hypothetical protein
MGREMARGRVGKITPSILLIVFVLSSLAPLLEFTTREAEAQTASRHIYTFSDGSTEAIAVYQSGTPARNVKVSMPRGAEVTAVEMTLSGASSTGWNQVLHQSRADWMGGEISNTETRADSVSLGLDSPEQEFYTHGMNENSSSGDAWLDNGSFSIRQPRMSNASETRFTSQRTTTSPFSSQAAASVLKYRGWTYVSKFDTKILNQLVKKVYSNNLTTHSSVIIESGNCNIPSPGSGWSSYYGFRDWTVGDDERLYAILSTDRQYATANTLKLLVFDIRYEDVWTCIQSYDISVNSYGSYTGISYDRSRDVIWVMHSTRRTVVPYTFNDDGSFERDGDLQYSYFSSYGEQNGLVAMNNMFFFRSKYSWSQDRLEAYAISGTSTTLAKQTGEVSIPDTGFGLFFDGQRLILIDHRQWSSRYYREFGSGWAYPISPQPGTSTWVSEPFDVSDDILVANVETSWTVTSAGDRVDYWVSADNGTHWVAVTNNETVHFSNPGQQLRWKLQLVGASAVSWWASMEYATAYQTSGSWTSPPIATGTQVGRMQPQWLATLPASTSMSVEVSNDNGTNWQTATNAQMVEFSVQGNLLKYRVTMSTTDDSVTPLLNSFSLDYEEGYPSAVRLDVGNDGSYEVILTGLLNQPVDISGPELVTAFNDNILDNGVGVSNVTLTLVAGSPGRIKVTNLDITYRLRTRVLDAELEGGMLVPDGATRVLMTRVSIGDEADRITQVQVELQATAGANPILQWQSGDSCSVLADEDGLVNFDVGNCSSSENSAGIVSILMPIGSNWSWDDEGDVEALITADDDLGRAVTRWETEGLNVRVENDIQLTNLVVTDSTGRVLASNDWVRGGLELTFQGAIAFEGTTYTPQAGQFSLELTGQNLTKDGDPMESEKQLHMESNPSHGAYSMVITSLIESSQGGMLFRVKAVNLPNGSDYVNPSYNSVRIVLDGNSPLVIAASPLDSSEVHKGNPNQPIRIVVQDSVDPPTQLALYYWREGQDDLNYDNMPDENEYVPMFLGTPETQPGGLNIFEGLVVDSMNKHGEKVSFYLTGTDAQGNVLGNGGGPVCTTDMKPCGENNPSLTPPDWGADLVTYTIREEFEPGLAVDNSTIVGHDDESPLHPGTQYIALLRLVDRNGWNDISTVKLALGGNIEQNDTAIWANFTKLDNGNLSMHLESGSVGLAVSNLYSSMERLEGNDSVLDLHIKFQLTWHFSELWDTDGEVTFVPVVEVADWPCKEGDTDPCFSERGGLGNDRWSLDNDLRFDMAPGHFTAIDLATGRNLYTGGDEQQTIAAGQVVRVNGRILFSEDQTPAPEGAFDIVVGNLELEWRAVPRDNGEFNVDILVPNVRSGHLDMLAWLENLPGLATDETPDEPRILLVVDGNSPVINSVLPEGDLRIRDASAVAVFLNTSDDHGFLVQRPAVLHYKVKAGESEVARGSQELGTLLDQYGYGHWTGVVDLTDQGVTQLLPGYNVDIWVTGADAAGNPYVSENNTESTPLSTWRIIRIGPVVNLLDMDIRWSDATPESGSEVTLDIAGNNTNAEEGTITFALQQKTKDGDWVDVHNGSTDALLRAHGDFVASIPLKTEEVDEETVERYRLVVLDGHVILDRISLDPLMLQPPIARDGAAISEQFTEQTGTVMLYLALMVALIVIVVLIVVNRRILESDEEEGSPIDQTVEVATEMAHPPPPPGYDSDGMPPPPPPGGFDPSEEPPPPPGYTPSVEEATSMPSTDAAPPATGSTPTQSEYWTDEKLLAQGWTQQQVDIWKAEQAEGGAAASSGDEVPEMEMSSAEASGLPGNHPAAKYKFSNSVLEGVMEKFGITDKDSFMRHAVLFDSDGNNYLSGKELESAAEHFTSQ